MTGIIYGLVGDDGSIRYVGQTRRTLAKRYNCHAYDVQRGRDLHVYRWWRIQAKPPTPVILEECPVALLNEREIAWIENLRSQGVDLCNLTSGGDCPSEVSEETRAKISARLKGRPSPTKGMKMSEETRAKLSAAHKGRIITDEHRARISESLRSSEKAIAARARVSASQVGRKRSPESLARMSEAQKLKAARMTPEQRKAQAAAANSAWRARAA